MELCFPDVPNFFVTGVLGPCYADLPLYRRLADPLSVLQPLGGVCGLPHQLATSCYKIAFDLHHRGIDLPMNAGSQVMTSRSVPTAKPYYKYKYGYEPSPVGVTVRELRLKDGGSHHGCAW